MSHLTLNTLDQFNFEGLNHQDMFCSQIRLFTHQAANSERIIQLYLSNGVFGTILLCKTYSERAC